MSLKDKASIVLPRGAYSKDSEIAAWNPQAQEIVSLGVTQATSNLTRVNEQGLIESVAANILPRDFVNGGCGEFNIWPQRTNFMLNSEDIAGWTPISGLGTTANNQTALDGATTADTLTGDGTSTACGLNQSVSVSAGGQHVFSCFLKAGTNNFAAIDISGFVGGSGTNFAYFDLANGTTPTAGAKIDLISNGWYWCQSAPFTVDAGDLSGNMSLYITLSDATRDFATAGDANGQSIYAWGAQVEAGSYATAYIPTGGSSETRDAIQVSQSGLSSVLGDAGGGIYAELKIFDNSSTKTIALNNTVGNDSINKRVELRVSTQLTFDVVNSGITECSISAGTIANDTYTKICAAYAVNAFSLHQDGATIGTDSSGNTFSDGDLTKIEFKASGGVPEFFEGSIRNLTIFDDAPTETQANSLTT